MTGAPLEHLRRLAVALAGPDGFVTGTRDHGSHLALAHLSGPRATHSATMTGADGRLCPVTPNSVSWAFFRASTDET
jgi:hypothetical protein